MYPHVHTGNSIVVTVKGKLVTVQEGATNFEPLRKALKEKNWAEAEKHLGLATSIEAWSKGSFKIDGETVTYKGEKLPPALTKRILATAAQGESPEGLLKFWEKLQRNPSWRSVEQLFPFLEHQGIPIQPNGNFLAYKGVKTNYTDQHSGRVDNKPGTVNEMARNKISDDPNTPCHYGFHVGDLSYASSFSQVTVVCEVDPEDVVCIPYDESKRKMRVCRYKVIGNHNGQLLPSTTYELEDVGTGSEIEIEEEELETEEEKPSEELKPVPGFAMPPPGVVAAIKAHKASEPKEKKLKNQRALDKEVKLKVPREWKKIHSMERRQLLDQSIGDLRTYASKVLHIVGASKIPGGKVPLVQHILKIRRNFR